MAINTLEQALAGMGQTMSQPAMAQRAREAIANGEVLEITVLVSPGKHGAAVTMHSLVASDRVSHGRLIKLR